MNRARMSAVVAVMMGLSALAADDAPPRPAVVRALAFSPDGRVLVAGYGGKDQPGGVTAWADAIRKRAWHHPAPAGVRSVSFAPDGRSLAAAHGTLTVLRLDAGTGRPAGELGPHPAVVRAVAHVPGTDLLATGSDGTIRLWDVTAGAVRTELQGHPKEVGSLVPSPHGRWLVSTGPDATRIWDVAAGQELKGVIRQERGYAYDGITFVGPDRVLLGNNHGDQTVIELPSGREVLRFKNAGGYAGAAYTPALGLAALYWHGSPQVSLADLAFREPTVAERVRIEALLREFDDESYAVREAASAAMRAVGSVAEPALRKAMADGPSAEVRMRAREARRVILDEPIRQLDGHTGSVGPMAFSPDGTLLATGADDGTVRLWDPQAGRELARLGIGP